MLCDNLCFLYFGNKSVLACWEPVLGFRCLLNTWELPSIAWLHGKILFFFFILTKATNPTWMNSSVRKLA